MQINITVESETLERILGAAAAEAVQRKDAALALDIAELNDRRKTEHDRTLNHQIAHAHMLGFMVGRN